MVRTAMPFRVRTGNLITADLITFHHFRGSESGVFKPLVAEGHMEHRELRNVFEQLHHRRVSIPHLESGVLPGPVTV